MKLKYEIIGLDKLESDLNKTGNASRLAAEDTARWLKTGYADALEFVGAVETGRAKKMVQVRTATEARNWLNTFEITTGVEYEQIIELGRKDTPKYPKRFPAKLLLQWLKSAEIVGEKFENRFDEILQK